MAFEGSVHKILYDTTFLKGPFAHQTLYRAKIVVIKVLIERSCHTKFYERSLQTPSSEQYCQSAKFHYCVGTREIT